jgi:hypothetical protein
VHDELHHNGQIVDRVRLLDHGVDVRRVFGAQADAPHGLSQLPEVGDAVGFEVRVGVATLIEQGLPLPDHTETLIVDHGDLDRNPFQCARGELLVGHLEATVAVDSPHDLVGLPHLGTHRSRHAVPHGPEAA